MQQDVHGLAISTSSARAAAEFDHAFLAYPKYRADAPELLSRVLTTDPEFGLAHKRRALHTPVPRQPLLGKRHTLRHWMRG
jgi:hypothetical protein